MDRYPRAFALAAWTKLLIPDSNHRSTPFLFSTWGRYTGSGKHPFAESAEKHIRKCLVWMYGRAQWERAEQDGKTPFSHLAASLAATTAYEAGATDKEIAAARAAAERGAGFILTASRRVRYWTAGAIIGSKTFVREVAASRWGKDKAEKKRLAFARILEQAKEGGVWVSAGIHSWRSVSN